MQSLMFLDCFDQKLLKKNLWGGSARPSLGKGRVKKFESDYVNKVKFVARLLRKKLAENLNSTY